MNLIKIQTTFLADTRKVEKIPLNEMELTIKIQFSMVYSQWHHFRYSYLKNIIL